jgi:dienelactone hydrolase
MADIVLFHHAHGLTVGVESFAERLRAAGHSVAVPDLFDGLTFDTVEEGVHHAEEVVGFDEIIARGEAAVTGLPGGLVYAGFSLGVLPAQRLAQKRPGVRGALLYHSGVPLSVFGGTWPAGVPLQIHAMEDDPWAELDVLRDLVDDVPGAELHLYPGSGHLFTDDSLDEYDADAAELVLERTLALLGDLDRR